MLTTLRTDPNALRRGGSFTFSLGIHTLALGWVAVSAAFSLNAPSRPIYEQEIKPNENRIVWYHLQSRVPNVRPAEAKLTRKPPRAVRKLEQNLIAGKKELPTPPQKVWVPEPPKVDVPKPKLEALPNLLAVAPSIKRPTRAFVPPPLVKPQVKPQPKLPDAPEIALKQSAITPADLPISANLPRAVRAFVPPPDPRRPAPNPQPDSAPPPEVTPLTMPSPTMAIVGLDPAKNIEIPKPPPPRDAGFSAGPKPNPEGESAPSTKALLSVPSLYANGGPKDMRPLTASDLAPGSQKNLMAAMGMGAIPRPSANTARAPHVSSSPDPRMNGKIIYMMAIQMPNITSYSGSWMVWFAEHQPESESAPVNMRAPEPMRKVDPKYIADAMHERVEGIVRLSAIIRKDGTIDEVELLKHLDDRLDRTAEEALAKWKFEPAQRDGSPIDVDAVFEIPFRLAPKVTR